MKYLFLSLLLFTFLVLPLVLAVEITDENSISNGVEGVTIIQPTNPILSNTQINVSVNGSFLALDGSNANTNIDIGSFDITLTGTLFPGLIDLGTNTIDDAELTGNWGLNGGSFTGVNSVIGTGNFQASIFTIDGTNGNDYKLGDSSAVAGQMFIQGQSANTQTRVAIYTQTSDRGDNSILEVYSLGSPTNQVNNERLQIGYSVSDTSMIIRSTASGSVIPIEIRTNPNTNQFLLETDGDNLMEAGNLILDADNIKLLIGEGQDFEAFHTGTNTQLFNNNGDLIINNTLGTNIVIIDSNVKYLNVTENITTHTGRLILGPTTPIEIWEDSSSSLVSELNFRTQSPEAGGGGFTRINILGGPGVNTQMQMSADRTAGRGFFTVGQKTGGGDNVGQMQFSGLGNKIGQIALWKFNVSRFGLSQDFSAITKYRVEVYGNTLLNESVDIIGNVNMTNNSIVDLFGIVFDNGDTITGNGSINIAIGNVLRATFDDEDTKFTGDVQNIDDVNRLSRFSEINFNNGTQAIAGITATNNVNRSIILGITGSNYDIGNPALVGDQPFLWTNAGQDMSFGVGSNNGFIWRNDLDAGVSAYSFTNNTLMSLGKAGDLNVMNVTVDNIKLNNSLLFRHTPSVDASTGFVNMFCKDDDKCYIIRSDGTQRRLLDSGAGSDIIDYELTFMNFNLFSNTTQFNNSVNVSNGNFNVDNNFTVSDYFFLDSDYSIPPGQNKILKRNSATKAVFGVQNEMAGASTDSGAGYVLNTSVGEYRIDLHSVADTNNPNDTVHHLLGANNREIWRLNSKADSEFRFEQGLDDSMFLINRTGTFITSLAGNGDCNLKINNFGLIYVDGCV